jgi:putative endonuclease
VWYEARGYEILARNWRCPAGEIDLILGHRGWLIFAEVKARTTVEFGYPAESVGRAKQVRLRRLAGRYLSERQGGAAPEGIRFDVVSVLAGQVEVVESAF